MSRAGIVVLVGVQVVALVALFVNYEKIQAWMTNPETWAWATDPQNQEALGDIGDGLILGIFLVPVLLGSLALIKYLSK